jgi:hypothetical protein
MQNCRLDPGEVCAAPPRYLEECKPCGTYQRAWKDYLAGQENEFLRAAVLKKVSPDKIQKEARR